MHAHLAFSFLFVWSMHACPSWLVWSVHSFRPHIMQISSISSSPTTGIHTNIQIHLPDWDREMGPDVPTMHRRLSMGKAKHALYSFFLFFYRFSWGWFPIGLECAGR